MADAPVNEAEAESAKTPIQDSAEFKEALAKEREQHRLQLEAEYRRKDKEWQDAHPEPKPTVGNGRDFFKEWGEKYGLPDGAARELTEATIGYVNGTLIPLHLKPITKSQRASDLRSQRADVRAGNPKLAKLDDQYHAEALKLLESVEQIGADSYARALHMVIGQNIEAIEAAREGQPKREAAPGPEPVASSGPSKSSKVTLTAKQQQFCDDKGFGAEDFVEMMKDRARKLEANGLSKVQVRARLGDLLGRLEF